MRDTESRSRALIGKWAVAREVRMDRRELIRRMVLNAICDDFENVDQIILPVVERVNDSA